MHIFTTDVMSVFVFELFYDINWYATASKKNTDIEYVVNHSIISIQLYIVCKHVILNDL